MSKTTNNPSSQEENPYGVFGRLYKGAKKDHQSRILSIYIGGALVIAFLFLLSLAPQVGERLGNLAVKKQTQESRAAVFDTGTMTFSADPTTVQAGQSTNLKWNAPQEDGYYRCVASGASDWKGTKPLAGNQQITPAQKTTYYLSCARRQGIRTATDIRKVEVIIGVTSSVFESNEKPPPCYLAVGTGGQSGYGDVDGNGKVTSQDALYILQYIAKTNKPASDIVATRLEESDVNNDGKIISTDALLIQRYIVGLIKTFPAVCPSTTKPITK